MAARRRQLDRTAGATQLWHPDRVAPAATGAATAWGLAQGQDARSRTGAPASLIKELHPSGPVPRQAGKPKP